MRKKFIGIFLLIFLAPQLPNSGSPLVPLGTLGEYPLWKLESEASTYILHTYIAG
jgi:hypothetical protein